MNSILHADLEAIIGSSVPFERLRNSLILITGATGLVGSMMVRTLLYANTKMNLNLSILAMVRDEIKAKDIFADHIFDSSLKLIKHDLLSDKISLTEDVDYIIHTASVTKSKTMVDNPVETIDIAINGTNTLLKFAASKPVKSFVYLSSMEVYGYFDGTCGPVTEEKQGYINPLLVRSCYPESKRMCENLCVAYASEYCVPVKIARLAQTFGAGILPVENRIFAQLAKSVIRGENIVLHTKGLSEGNYTYLSETIEALLLVLLKGENGEAYNIANEQCHTTIAEMAHMVADEIANGKIDVIYDIPDNNLFGYAADTHMMLSAAKIKQLGWKPKINLKEAYIRTIEYMKGEN